MIGRRQTPGSGGSGGVDRDVSRVAQKWAHRVGRGDRGDKRNHFLAETLSKLRLFGTS
jgi:hypothetical protein